MTSQKYIQSLRRPCVLQNVISGRIVKAPSITEFCRKARLYKNAKYHITPVLAGQRPSYKGWFLPKTLDRRLNLRDVYGNVYKDISIRQWIKKHGMTAVSAIKLLDGRIERTSLGRLTLASVKETGFLKPRATQIVGVTLRKGRWTVKANSLPQAAARLCYAPTAFYPLLYGTKDQVNGYSLTNVKLKRRQVLNISL